MKPPLDAGPCFVARIAHDCPRTVGSGGIVGKCTTGSRYSRKGRVDGVTEAVTLVELQEPQQRESGGTREDKTKLLNPCLPQLLAASTLQAGTAQGREQS